MALSKKELKEMIQAGQVLGPVLKVPRTDVEYKKTVEYMETLLDLVGEDENHVLAPILNTLGDIIHEYEESFIPSLTTTAIERLRDLMKLHGLTQKDLVSEFGSQSIVSEVLNHKRALNKKQIQALSKRFKLSPEVFFD